MKPCINTIDEPPLVTNLVLDSLYWIGVAVILVLILPMTLYWGIREMLRFPEHPVIFQKSNPHRLLGSSVSRRQIQGRNLSSISKKVCPIPTRDRQDINTN
jgi:hypothetical protein